MEFEYLVPENSRLRARISQRSNLKYVHRVLEHYDDRQKQDFRDSCLGFLGDVAEIQFSAQLIQQLVFRTMKTNKTNELWFKVHGHCCRFGLQEYALVTGLRCGEPVHDDDYSRVVAKTRLKDKYFKSLDRISCAQIEKTFLRPSTSRADRYKLGLALIVEGVFNAPDNNVGVDETILSIVDDLDLFFAYPWGRVGYTRLLKGWRGEWAYKFREGKRKNDKEVSYTIHGFPIAMQIWAFEAIPELGARFGQRIGDRAPRLLNWMATKQTQQRTYDKFFKNVQLHVYATLRPTDFERDQPYISTLTPFADHAVPELDDITTSILDPQFATDTHTGEVGEDESSSRSDDDNPGSDGEEPTDRESDDRSSDSTGDGDGSSEDSETEQPRGRRPTCVYSAAYVPGHTGPPDNGPSTSTHRGTQSADSLTREDLEGMLLDQRVLIEMRMRTFKLETMEHVTAEFAKLREFISTALAQAFSNNVGPSAAFPVQPVQSFFVPEDEQGVHFHRSPAEEEYADDSGGHDISGGIPSEGAGPATESFHANTEMHEVVGGDMEENLVESRTEVRVPSSVDMEVEGGIPGEGAGTATESGAGTTTEMHAVVGGDMEENLVSSRTEALVPSSIAMEVEEAVGVEPGGPVGPSVPEVSKDKAVPTSRRRSARLRRPAASTRTPYTRGRGRLPKKR